MSPGAPPYPGARRLDMVRTLAVLATFIALAFAAPMASADDHIPRSAGSKGTVTAWDEFQHRVLEHRFCARTRNSWDYVSCGNRLRDELKISLCAARGPGNHH